MASATSLSYPDGYGLRTGPQLRRPLVCGSVCAVLFSVLALATLIHLGLLARIRRSRSCSSGRLRSTLLSFVPVTVLWPLDRRERRTPWLLAAAFLWGGCIATAIALPFNTAIFKLVDQWVAQNPDIIRLLGPDAPMLLAAPISGPITEELARGLGVIVIFWLLRAEHNGVRDGIVYGALVGAGFNWFEAALYVAQGYAEYRVAPYGLQLGGRYGSGLAGTRYLPACSVPLRLALQARRPWVQALAPLFGLILAIAGHMVNNALPLIAVLVGVAPPRREPPPWVFSKRSRSTR